MTHHGTAFRIVLACLVSPYGISREARAADTTRPPFKLLRYDEDYSFLSDPAQRTEFWDAVKYIPVAGGRAGFLSLGGDVRERVVG